MKPIKEFLDKIKWDPREHPADYIIFYYDRIEKKLVPLHYPHQKK